MAIVYAIAYFIAFGSKDTKEFKNLATNCNKGSYYTPQELAIRKIAESKTNFDIMESFRKSCEQVKADLQDRRTSDKVMALMELRSHALCYNFTFIGIVKSTKFPKSKLEDFADYEGIKQLPVKYLIQHVDFGNNINKALATVFGLTLKKRRGLCESYLVLEDGIVYNMKEELSKLLMNDVKINFIDEIEKNGKIEE